MKIGIDARTLSYEYTGIPIFVHDVLKYWCEHNTEDEFIMYSNRPFELDFELGGNWRIVIDSFKLGTVWVRTRLPGLIRKDRPDIFWEPMHFLPGRVKGVKYIVSVMDLAVYLHPEWGASRDSVMEKLFLKSSCKKADLIIAISESTKRDIMENFGISGEKVRTIYIGDSPYNSGVSDLTEKENAEILKKLNLTSGDYFLFVSTLEPRKNVTVLVKAFNILKEEGYTGKLVLAGKRGWKAEEIYHEIESSPFSDSIVLTGYIGEREKECLYRNAEALVYPSRYEGFGFPVVEAMSVGIPVITSYNSSLPEVGGDLPFYLQDIDDPRELAGLMKEAAGLSGEARRDLAAREMERAKTFSRKKSAEQIYSEMRSLISISEK